MTLEEMIKACKANLAEQKEIGDELAVKATKGMIAELEKLLGETV